VVTRERDTSGDGKSGRLRDPEQPVTTGTATASSCDRHHIHCVSFATVAAALLSHWPQKLNRWKNLFWKKAALTITFSSLKNWPSDIQPPTHSCWTAIVDWCRVGLQCSAGPCFAKAGTMPDPKRNEYLSCKVMRRSGWVFRSSFWCDSCVCVCRNVRLPRMTQGCLASQMKDHQDSLNFLVVFT
jgi:hypothetical protein